MSVPVGVLRSRDVIQTPQGKRLTVKSMTLPSPGQRHPGTRLHFTEGGDYFVPADSLQLFTLIHCPWSEGVTEEEAFGKLVDAQFEFESCPKDAAVIVRDGYVKRFLKAVCVYWLGKPLEPTDEDCLAGRCDHPKGLAGCLIYQVNNPPPREC